MEIQRTLIRKKLDENRSIYFSSHSIKTEDQEDKAPCSRASFGTSCRSSLPGFGGFLGLGSASAASFAACRWARADSAPLAPPLAPPALRASLAALAASRLALASSRRAFSSSALVFFWCSTMHVHARVQAQRSTHESVTVNSRNAIQLNNTRGKRLLIKQWIQ